MISAPPRASFALPRLPPSSFPSSFRRTVWFPAGRDVWDVLEGGIPATSYTLECECPRWPRRNSLGVGGGRRANLLAHRFALGVGVGVGVSEQESGGRWGGVRGSLRRCAESTGLSGSLPVQLAVTQPLRFRFRLRLRFLFAYDVTGALIRAHLVDHAWCAVGHDVSTFPRSRPIWQLLREREREMVAMFGLEDGWMNGWMEL